MRRPWDKHGRRERGAEMGIRMEGRGKRKKFIGLCVCAAALLCGCGGRSEEDGLVLVEQENTEISYSFGVAALGDVTKSQRVTCTYRQINGLEVSFSTGGKLIDRVYVREGDSVKKGDLLAELSAGSLERQIAELEYRIARNELLLGYVDTNESIQISAQWVYGWGEESIKAAVAGIQKQSEYQRQDYSDALEIDRKKLENLRQELKASRVYAEADGVVYDLKERLEGSTSRAEETVMVIMDPSQCFFETNVPELADRFHEGETVSMVMAYGAAGQYELMPWRMEEWGETQLFSIYDGPDSGNLEVGNSGTMTLVLEQKKNVLCVPAGAVHSSGEDEYVYVLGADEMREVRWVRTGLHGNDAVEISEGLSEGERVILR